MFPVPRSMSRIDRLAGDPERLALRARRRRHPRIRPSGHRRCRTPRWRAPSAAAATTGSAMSDASAPWPVASVRKPSPPKLLSATQKTVDAASPSAVRTWRRVGRLRRIADGRRVARSRRRRPWALRSLRRGSTFDRARRWPRSRWRPSAEAKAARPTRAARELKKQPPGEDRRRARRRRGADASRSPIARPEAPSCAGSGRASRCPPAPHRPAANPMVETVAKVRASLRRRPRRCAGGSRRRRRR